MNNYQIFWTRGQSFRVILSAVLFAAFAAPAFIACGNSTSPAATSDPVVAAVVLDPPSVNITMDDLKPIQFSATVAGTGSPSQDVIWTIVESNSVSTISDAGVLTVAGNEARTSLTIRATSAVDTAIYGKASVFIYKNQNQFPVVQGVTVSPKTASVKKGSSKAFTAAVTGTNVTQDVLWTIVESNSVSAISDAGVLTMSSAETNSTLTIKAAAVNSPAKYDVAAVTVTSSSGDNPGVAVPGGGDINGTWRGTVIDSGVNNDLIYVFSNNVNWELFSVSGSIRTRMMKGTFRANGNELTLTTSHIHGAYVNNVLLANSPNDDWKVDASKYYTVDELNSAMEIILRVYYTSLFEGSFTGEALEKQVNSMIENGNFDLSSAFEELRGEYKVSATELILIGEESDLILTRQDSAL